MHRESGRSGSSQGFGRSVKPGQKRSLTYSITESTQDKLDNTGEKQRIFINNFYDILVDDGLDGGAFAYIKFI